MKMELDDTMALTKEQIAYIRKNQKRVENRVSYKMWVDFYDFMKTYYDIDDGDLGFLFEKVWKMMDARHSFGSQTNAWAAWESAVWLLKKKGHTIPQYWNPIIEKMTEQ